ncbi:hypothetical protein PACTADRAFT_3289 [Pachysolen tannophilus NRRL Y-2460]|uniref:Uncharacterized protein n=1 Tax=Pachysolen tannophilus NRRL Y-2460 TaxID=669874 RepID=A0A1E4TVB6_PACTA|nr:hypothetical protein PACTADRAFT_3289 [Pachysolen tannophilus NRRL Y-2460]
MTNKEHRKRASMLNSFGFGSNNAHKQEAHSHNQGNNHKRTIVIPKDGAGVSSEKLSSRDLKSNLSSASLLNNIPTLPQSSLGGFPGSDMSTLSQAAARSPVASPSPQPVSQQHSPQVAQVASIAPVAPVASVAPIPQEPQEPKEPKEPASLSSLQQQKPQRQDQSLAADAVAKSIPSAVVAPPATINGSIVTRKTLRRKPPPPPSETEAAEKQQQQLQQKQQQPHLSKLKTSLDNESSAPSANVHSLATPVTLTSSVYSPISTSNAEKRKIDSNNSSSDQINANGNGNANGSKLAYNTETVKQEDEETEKLSTLLKRNQSLNKKVDQFLSHSRDSSLVTESNFNTNKLEEDSQFQPTELIREETNEDYGNKQKNDNLNLFTINRKDLAFIDLHSIVGNSNDETEKIGAQPQHNLKILKTDLQTADKGRDDKQNSTTFTTANTNNLSLSNTVSDDEYFDVDDGLEQNKKDGKEIDSDHPNNNTDNDDINVVDIDAFEVSPYIMDTIDTSFSNVEESNEPVDRHFDYENSPQSLKQRSSMVFIDDQEGTSDNEISDKGSICVNVNFNNDQEPIDNKVGAAKIHLASPTFDRESGSPSNFDDQIPYDPDPLPPWNADINSNYYAVTKPELDSSSIQPPHLNNNSNEEIDENKINRQPENKNDYYNDGVNPYLEDEDSANDELRFTARSPFYSPFEQPDDTTPKRMIITNNITDDEDSDEYKKKLDQNVADARNSYFGTVDIDEFNEKHQNLEVPAAISKSDQQPRKLSSSSVITPNEGQQFADAYDRREEVTVAPVSYSDAKSSMLGNVEPYPTMDDNEMHRDLSQELILPSIQQPITSTTPKRKVRREPPDVPVTGRTGRSLSVSKPQQTIFVDNAPIQQDELPQPVLSPKTSTNFSINSVVPPTHCDPIASNSDKVNTNAEAGRSDTRKVVPKAVVHPGEGKKSAYIMAIRRKAGTAYSNAPSSKWGLPLAIRPESQKKKLSPLSINTPSSRYYKSVGGSMSLFKKGVMTSSDIKHGNLKPRLLSSEIDEEADNGEASMSAGNGGNALAHTQLSGFVNPAITSELNSVNSNSADSSSSQQNNSGMLLKYKTSSADINNEGNDLFYDDDLVTQLQSHHPTNFDDLDDAISTSEIESNTSGIRRKESVVSYMPGNDNKLKLFIANPDNDDDNDDDESE